MPKSSTGKTGGPARVRLVVIDAEVSDGDLSALTQALQNALRPAAPQSGPRVQSGTSVRTISHQTPADEDAVEDESDVEDTEGFDIAERPAKPRSQRKPPKAPDVIDIEMNGEVSFASFAKGKDNESQHKKYLIAAAWLHDHRNTPVVTDSHIYTCFRSIGWSTNIPDFGAPLRELKSRKFFTTPERGQYAINHLGLDYVKRLGNDDGAA